ncbi:MAG: hypothetical protein A7316_06815 [Candidatus Altiarchaeales archaeon WOR_SM1_86-2]|nr:MAG: hypothetical protein A7316_06815 [Candidatus Altiarchaeales archaeon WOR_SM1_86-2]ODS39952.1 MAG: hypothetical protein A7315_02735 [Candidatus Altiarchaeales archaeon WOR_SM1_79]
MKVMEVSLGPKTTLPRSVFKDMGISKREKVILIVRKTGLIAMKKTSNLTDMLVGLVETKNKEYDKSEYSEYLLDRV